jgi:gamma-glutamylaminecyclotransferase
MIDSPGLGERVAGELYEVDAVALSAMDELEGIGKPDGYHRKALRVQAATAGDDTVVLAHTYMKHAHQVVDADVRVGPLAEYTPAHAALYRKRGEQAY